MKFLRVCARKTSTSGGKPLKIQSEVSVFLVSFGVMCKYVERIAIFHGIHG